MIWFWLVDLGHMSEHHWIRAVHADDGEVARSGADASNHSINSWSGYYHVSSSDEIQIWLISFGSLKDPIYIGSLSVKILLCILSPSSAAEGSAGRSPQYQRAPRSLLRPFFLAFRSSFLILFLESVSPLSFCFRIFSTFPSSWLGLLLRIVGRKIRPMTLLRILK